MTNDTLMVAYNFTNATTALVVQNNATDSNFINVYALLCRNCDVPPGTDFADAYGGLIALLFFALFTPGCSSCVDVLRMLAAWLSTRVDVAADEMAKRIDCCNNKNEEARVVVRDGDGGGDGGDGEQQAAGGAPSSPDDQPSLLWGCVAGSSVSDDQPTEPEKRRTRLNELETEVDVIRARERRVQNDAMSDEEVCARTDEVEVEKKALLRAEQAKPAGRDPLVDVASTEDKAAETVDDSGGAGDVMMTVVAPEDAGAAEAKGDGAQDD